jgi:putative peptidoglycan lipid II flippase
VAERAAAVSATRRFNVNNAGVRQILGLMGRRSSALPPMQINVFVSTSSLAIAIRPPAHPNGPVSCSTTVRFRVSVGVFGVAIATPPCRRCRAAQPIGLQQFVRLAHSLALVFLLCIPSAVGLAVLAKPIVALVFEHGKFTARHRPTASALAAYAISWPDTAPSKCCRRRSRAGRRAHADADQLGIDRRNYVMNSLLVGRSAMSV